MFALQFLGAASASTGVARIAERGLGQALDRRGLESPADQLLDRVETTLVVRRNQRERDA
jgi:hypothetical protein